MRMVAIVVLGLALLDSRAAYADAKITIRYTREESILTPNPRQNSYVRDTSLILTKDKKVKYVTSVRGSYIKSQELRFEQPNTITTAGGSYVVMRVRIDGGRIIFASFFPTYKVIDTINIENENCQATVEFALLPGHKVFEDRNFSTKEPMTSSDVRASGVSCEISELPN